MRDGRAGDVFGGCARIDEVLADPAASFWLKAALRSSLCRDPVRCRPRFGDPGAAAGTKGASKFCLGVDDIGSVIPFQPRLSASRKR